MPGWAATTIAISLAIIALAYVAIIVAMMTVFKGVADQATSVSREISEFRKEMGPTLKYLGELGREGANVAEMAKDEVKEIIRTTRGLRMEVERASKRAKRRLEDFESVIEVVQEEVEETVLDVGAALRSTRTGAGMIGQLRRLLVPARTSRRK